MKLKLTFLLLAFMQIASAQNPQKDMDTTRYGRNQAVGKYADIRGFKMYYEVYGKGEPLLIIHGNGGSINNFVYQIPYFAKNYQVIIADSRAQGKSVDHKDSLSYEMMADDLNALLDRLNIKQANVIGWSDGGINGLLLAIHHPDKVKKLAVTGANLWPDTSAVDPFVYDMVLKQNKVAADTIKKIKNLTPEMKDQVKLLHLLSYEPHIKLEDVSKITCPTLVIGGDHDVIRPKHTMLIADHIPNSYLWILPNSGHSTPLFYKDLFNQVVGDFFAKPFRKIEKYGRFN
ncbi:alpha/beta fold hydrolase [Mucilaginibacter sp. L3T2-6]|uniref:alpha/beta fold hydrolase n=1 Tax=Mucilaginibacter sp. L3T2-6 TaxID=3062491 RepID=UPI0026750184|nr:alpha/beta hydrolase [Mucilaginibacter sp. L3T2-6]MDO3640632.1 alpha/beta hydrolase [Mucilaginibacter sp. L3T2-6]MDV6213029.1 alpha/beta hydrolase [Mucilaginibacter sp. L3T2-6]